MRNILNQNLPFTIVEQKFTIGEFCNFISLALLAFVLFKPACQLLVVAWGAN